MNILNRVSKLENGRRESRGTCLPRMVRVLCRGYAREVAMGTRKPEDATETAALAHLQSIPSTAGASLAEKMEAVILRGKAKRENLEDCHG